MKKLKLGIFTTFLMVSLLLIPEVCGEGVGVDVIGGKKEVTDWVAQATLDLTTACKILDIRLRPEQVGVYELDPSGRATRVPSQVDKATDRGLYTVSWRVPGKLESGASREFLIGFKRPGEPIEESHPIRVQSDRDTATVTNTNTSTGDRIVLQHHRGAGGMIGQVIIAGTPAQLPWNDKIFDGTIYSLAKHRAQRMDIIAEGPLRATIEAESQYLESGKIPSSKPQAVYRFTTYAGLPFTVVEALVTQDFGHQWRGLHFMEILTRSGGFTHYWTDKIGPAKLQQVGSAREGTEWAAVYKERVLIALCDSLEPFVYDGGGELFEDGVTTPRHPAYLKSANVPMSALRHPFKAALIWGAGPKAVKDGTVQRWSEILADPPKVQVSFEALDKRVAQMEQALQEKEKPLADLSGEAWAQAHVMVTVSRVQLSIARQRLLVGRFGEALEAGNACEKALAAQAGEVQLIKKGTILAGTIRGYPYLGNDKVAFLWAKAQDGAGLMSIFDRRRGRELLKVDPRQAPLWQIGVKGRKGGVGYENIGTPCQVKADADEKEGRLRFRWSKDVLVELEASLQADELLLRTRLQAKTTSKASGLVNVTFPIIEDIMPLTPQAKQDKVLETWGVGWELPSPLISGKVAYSRNPCAMQFNAVHGDGLGLYIAEEDGESHRKEMTWTPDSDSQTLDFAISHPVLNWGAESFVSEYKSPGDIVLGPFHGDWYDAARLYRKWALTAPWCAKGPIYERRDYPKWFLKSPYWMIGGLGDEGGIQRIKTSFQFYQLPLAVCHTIPWRFAVEQTDGEPEYFPPRLGSEGFRRTVADLHEKGIWIVCSTNGWNWDRNTELWQTKEGHKGAILESSGEILVWGAISDPGDLMVSMCPATKLWRQTMLEVSKKLIGDYGVAGIYYDFLNFNVSDCYNEKHGHPICGGNYWSEAVHGFYELMRTECQKLNPQVMFTGEGVAEFLIDDLDSFLCGGQSSGTPLFPAVYHGYTHLYGAERNKAHSPLQVGRLWLWGRQNGWNNMEYKLTVRPMGKYYRRLLKCRWEFGTPYLGYGEMLRPPRIKGDLPEIAAEGGYGSFTAPAVEGTAWKAPDGTLGLFFLNYDDKPHKFTWSMDLTETGINDSRRLKLSRWMEEEGLKPLKEIKGGVIKERMSIEPWGIIALKMEVKP